MNDRGIYNQKELEAVAKKSASGDRQVWWGHLLATAGVLAGLFWGLRYFGASDAQLVAGVVVASTVCLVAVINSAVRVMHVSLTLLVASVEWVGRKQLGEYEIKLLSYEFKIRYICHFLHLEETHILQR